MGRKMTLENEVLEENIECMSISMSEKELLKRYEELEAKETKCFRGLEKYQGNSETVFRIRQELLDIDREQDEIIAMLNHCEDRQISGHQRFNQKLTGGITFERFKKVHQKNIPAFRSTIQPSLF